MSTTPSGTYVSSEGRAPGYGRARLWVGISGVGTMVTLTTAALAAGLPAAVDAMVSPGVGAAALALAVYSISHAAVQLPFDLFGGHLLPVWYGRSRQGLRTFLGRLLRGAVVYACVLCVSLVALLAAGRVGGVWGVVALGAVASFLLLWGRMAVARSLARLGVESSGGQLPDVTVASDDEGFTGGVLGVVRPRRVVLPARWQVSLTPEQLACVRLRRELAGTSGTWRRGRMLALAFTLSGVGLSAAIVGPGRLGSAGGTIELSLWFTLWSFVGLLILPTVSRRGVAELDAYVRAAGVSETLAKATARALDADQDDEPERPALVETIFHPIPSVGNRDHAVARPAPGAWDAARTAVYLGLAGGGLLGRAVHCNCGRPALWAFLPVD
jgi:hypothetical protein